LKANLASPTFTGTVSGITSSMVGLSNVDNTTDASKPVSTATQAALNLKANLASPTFTGTVSAPTQVSTDNTTKVATTAYVKTVVGELVDFAPEAIDTLNELAAALGDDPNFATTVTNSIASKANIASPTFTGTVGGITKTMVQLGNVDNTSDAAKPVSTAQQTALDLKANLASPTFTGDVNFADKIVTDGGTTTLTNTANKLTSARNDGDNANYIVATGTSAYNRIYAGGTSGINHIESKRTNSNGNRIYGSGTGTRNLIDTDSGYNDLQSRITSGLANNIQAPNGGYNMIRANGTNGQNFLDAKTINWIKVDNIEKIKVEANTTTLTNTNIDINGDATISGDLIVDGTSKSNEIWVGANTWQIEDIGIYFTRGRTRGLNYQNHYITARFDGAANSGGGNKMKFYIDDGLTGNGTSHATPLTLNPNGVDVTGDLDVTGNLTVSNPNEIYYKGETLDARFHSLDNDYYTEAESDARFVNVAGDTMTGDLIVDGLIVTGDSIQSNDNRLDIYPNTTSLNSSGYIEMRSTGTKIAGTSITFRTDTDNTTYGTDRMSIAQDGNITMTGGLDTVGDVNFADKIVTDGGTTTLTNTNIDINGDVNITGNIIVDGTSHNRLISSKTSGNTGNLIDCDNGANNVLKTTSAGTTQIKINSTTKVEVGDATTTLTNTNINVVGNLDVTGQIAGNGLRCDNTSGGASKDLGVLWLANGSTTGSTTPGHWTAWNDTADGLRFEYKSLITSGWTNKGYISKGSYTGVFNNFTGQHHNYAINETVDEKGFIVSSTGKYRNQMTNCDECNKYKITINESLPIVEYSQQVNDTKVWGVISDKDDTNTTRQKPFGNFVTEYEQSEEDRPLTINSLGEGAIWVSNINGPIKNGDYITTGQLPGLGVKQDDDILHSYTVAKITTDCSFDETEIVPRKKLRYETITKTREKNIEVEKDVFDYWEDDFNDETYYENVERQIIDKVSKIIQEDIITYDVSGIPSVQVIEKTVEEEVPRVTNVETTDASGNITITEVPTMETVSITKTRNIPKMIDVILKDASNNNLLDSQGDPIIKQYQAKKPVYKKEIINETITETYDVERAVIDPVTLQYVYDYETDNSGNQIYVEKYEMKYIIVSTDKFSVYNNGEHTELYKEFPGDFTNTHINDESIVGKTYKMAFLGCTYHCG